MDSLGPDAQHMMAPYCEASEVELKAEHLLGTDSCLSHGFAP